MRCRYDCAALGRDELGPQLADWQGTSITGAMAMGTAATGLGNDEGVDG